MLALPMRADLSTQSQAAGARGKECLQKKIELASLDGETWVRRSRSSQELVPPTVVTTGQAL